MTSCTGTQPGDQCREVLCENNLPQWPTVPGEHLCYVEGAKSISCLSVTRFTRPFFCMQPHAFGYNNDIFPPAVRVQHGCAAEFRVCYSPSAFSDYLYQAPGFSYIDHSNEYKDTRRKSYNNSTTHVTETDDDIDPTTWSVQMSTTQSNISLNTTKTSVHKNFTDIVTNATRVIHSTKAQPVDPVPYIAATVPVVFIIVVFLLLYILWKRARRKDLQAAIQSHKESTNQTIREIDAFKMSSENAVTATHLPRCEHIFDQTSTNENRGQNNVPASKCFRISSCETSPCTRKSDHLYYVLESKSGQQNGNPYCISEIPNNGETYDYLRNRWSEISDDRYDHLTFPDIYFELGHTNRNKDIIGHEYAHINMALSTSHHSENIIKF